MLNVSQPFGLSRPVTEIALVFTLQCGSYPVSYPTGTDICCGRISAADKQSRHNSWNPVSLRPHVLHSMSDWTLEQVRIRRKSAVEYRVQEVGCNAKSPALQLLSRATLLTGMCTCTHFLAPMMYLAGRLNCSRVSARYSDRSRVGMTLYYPEAEHCQFHLCSYCGSPYYG
jgi:hypothetical protein